MTPKIKYTVTVGTNTVFTVEDLGTKHKAL